MLGSDVREVFEAVIPNEALSALVEHPGSSSASANAAR
jgi:hypothetical protein